MPRAAHQLGELSCAIDIRARVAEENASHWPSRPIGTCAANRLPAQDLEQAMGERRGSLLTVENGCNLYEICPPLDLSFKIGLQWQAGYGLTNGGLIE
jgi:hypothetical protein